MQETKKQSPETRSRHGVSREERFERKRLIADDTPVIVKPFSWEEFKKTDEERAELANAKASWRATMRAAGLNKRCRMINPVCARKNG